MQISFFRVCGPSAAPPNSPLTVKAVAALVTPGTHRERVIEFVDRIASHVARVQ